MNEKQDRYWMRRALALARRSLGATQPNPMVGAIVLDQNGAWVGRGFHRQAGGPHAEVFAFDEAGDKAKGGTLYVTMEPCSTQGRTPPCSKRVIESGVSRVVIASLDPNPDHQGRAIHLLEDAGINVSTDCMTDEADRLNEPFKMWMEHKRPFVTAKAAVSLDGKIGKVDKRILLSGDVAERTTMKLRAEAGAILVGVQTVLTDDPKLNVRGIYESREPIRVVLDSNLRMPANASMFSHAGGPIWVFCLASASEENKKKLEDKGAHVFPLSNKITVEDVLAKLGDEGVTAVLVEGGAQVFDSFFDANCVDRLVLYLTPHILGEEGTVPITKKGPFRLKYQSVIRRGQDWIVVGTTAKS